MELVIHQIYLAGDVGKMRSLISMVFVLVKMSSFDIYQKNNAYHVPAYLALAHIGMWLIQLVIATRMH